MSREQKSVIIYDKNSEPVPMAELSKALKELEMRNPSATRMSIFGGNEGAGDVSPTATVAQKTKPFETSSTATYKAPGLFGGVIAPPPEQRPPPQIDFGAGSSLPGGVFSSHKPVKTSGASEHVRKRSPAPKLRPYPVPGGIYHNQKLVGTTTSGLFPPASSVPLSEQLNPVLDGLKERRESSQIPGTRKKINFPHKSVRVSEVNVMDFSPTFVLITVGPIDHQRTFAIHESLLSTHSPIFKQQLAEQVVEHNHKTIDMPDTDPTAFALYHQFLYTGQIPSKTPDIVEHTSLCNLYNLAFSLQDTAAQNAACDAIHAKATEFTEDIQAILPAREHIDIIFSGTSEACAGKRLMVDLYTAHAKGEWFDGGETWPAEFMSKLAVSLMGERPVGVVGQLVKRREEYHVVSGEKDGVGVEL